MPIQIIITGETTAEAVKHITELAEKMTQQTNIVRISAPAELSVVQDVEPRATRKPRTVGKAPELAAPFEAGSKSDPLAAYNEIAASVGAPVVDAGVEASEALKAVAAVVKEDAAALSQTVDEPKIEEPVVLDRAGKQKIITEALKAAHAANDRNMDKAKAALGIASDAPAFSMWSDADMDRVYAVATAA